MSKINDGGTAFPNSVQPDFQYAEAGMSLRDWFAGQALAGLCANSIPGGHHRPEVRADEAYRQADAMLSARSNRGEEDNG